MNTELVGMGGGKKGHKGLNLKALLVTMTELGNLKSVTLSDLRPYVTKLSLRTV